mmetsp:Transcript_4527/g.11455  ORF Transcript_4527/g.11455 Transcript_4527/m.11455 type:complete len:908 (-) Transcript_4527:2200-4923(-)
MDFDGFDFGDGFPGAGSSTYHQQHQQQQQQQHGYATTRTRTTTTAAPNSINVNNPASEGYDPRRGSGSSSTNHQGTSYGGATAYHQNGTTNQYTNMTLLNTANAAPQAAPLHHHTPLMPPQGIYQQQQQGSGQYQTHLQFVQGQQQQPPPPQQQPQQVQYHQHAAPAAALALPTAHLGAPVATHNSRQSSSHQQSSRRRRSSDQHHNTHHNHQQQQQQQQLQQMYNTGVMSSSSSSSRRTSSSGRSSGQLVQTKRRKLEQIKSEPWMEAIQLNITNLSTKPMSGTVVIQLLQRRADEVLTRYLPCVDFLVQCQQDLRRGLQEATSKRVYHNMIRDKLTPHQFYTQYIARLPERFHEKNRDVMSAENLKESIGEMRKLCENAKNAQRQGCETVKNTFLGGMKDGESWGLRKWLSKHGGALMICNDSECILHAVQKLNRSDDATIKLARKMRPLAKTSLTRLTKDVPSSYQEQSSAHPFLPFFHRLEAALRGLSNFDPEDDDVICLDSDDDEIEILKSAPPKPGPKERRSSVGASAKNNNDRNPPNATNKRKAVDIIIDDDDDDDDVGANKKNGNSNSSSSQKGKSAKTSTSAQSSKSKNTKAGSKKSSKASLESKPPAKKRAKKSSDGFSAAATYNDNDIIGIDSSINGLMGNDQPDADGDSDYMKALLRTLNDEMDDDDDVMNINFDEIDRRTSLLDGAGNIEGSFDLPSSLDRIAFYFESNQQDLVRPTSSHLVRKGAFWDQAGPYAGVLRSFSTLLKDPDSKMLLIDPTDVQKSKRYLLIVKHPLCFRDIVVSLVAHFDAIEMTVLGNPGSLPSHSLSSWNMWRGDDLVMAIDLVFLNALAYDKATDGSKTNIRSRINKLRKILWADVRDIIERYSPGSDAEMKKKMHPTRRSESSGFVMYKSSK